MLVRALAIGLLSGSLGLGVVVAPGCTNGTTPICTGDAGCGPGFEDSALDAVEDASREQ
jgi:hypothetical protein